MASTVRAQEASSSAPPGFTYHVFLSFRGEDTRKTFTDHLYTALDRAGFHTFRDDDGIKRGENINSELQRAIQESRISIIVFSKDYASSKWCLDELVRILKQKRTSEHQILPVFYDVTPSDVRKQTRSFKESFLMHERRFKTEAIEKRSQWMDKIEEWRAALREIADLAGIDLKSQDGGYESKCIERIVAEVEEKLKPIILSNGPKLIGLHSRARDINLWLQDGSNDVSMYAISGVGGIGKTTLAKYVYNINFQRFEGSSFLANVSEISRQPNGLVCLQRRLLSDITNYKKEIHNISEGISWIKLALCHKRVLIVLDDVDEIDQINAVLGMREWLYPENKILITTKDEQLLKCHGIHTVHRIECLDYHESLELFSWHAFRQDHPIEAYVEHMERALKYCGGLPLALELLGSILFGESVVVWRDMLERLETIPNHQILKKMRISYDSLPDDYCKDLFLHIACFFVGEDRDFIVKVLDGCELSTTIGIKVLVRKCMLKIEDNKVMMHQLLRDMGREIVRLESPKKSEERSRLWRQIDSYDVMRKKSVMLAHASSLGEKRQLLVADLTDGVAKTDTYINAAFRSSRINEVYLFMKNKYVRLDYAPGTVNDKVLYGPVLIGEGFPSLTGTPFAEDGIDCAFSASEDGDKAFIFSRNLCAYIDYAPGTPDDKIINGPMTITSMFPFFKGTPFESGIDAAFESTFEYEAYLFKGDQYARINYGPYSKCLFTSSIAEGFPSLRNTIFESGMDAAFDSHRYDEAYLFKGDSYARINFAPGTSDDYIINNRIEKILPKWPSLRSILPRRKLRY